MKNVAVPQLNLNQLRVFESAYRLKSMTLAAQELFLTQSGVSQHIKSLETDLGVPLFARNRSELYPTEQATSLYQSCLRSFSDLGQTVEKISQKDDRKVAGLIRIGVPTEFAHNVLMPIFGSFSELHPDVQVEFVYGFSIEMQNKLDNGEIDLAFIDSLKASSRTASEIVYTETLSLVASLEYMKRKNIGMKEKLSFITQLEFLDYEHHEPVLRMWLQHHYGKKNVPLKVRAWAMSVAGIAQLIHQHMGAGVVPDHIIEQMKSRGEALHIFKGSKGVLKNQISLAWLKKRPLNTASEEFKKYSLKRFSEKK